jgi:predicted ribosome quality control (RQC) complex YloA/Tae2 family protein
VSTGQVSTGQVPTDPVATDPVARLAALQQWLDAHPDLLPARKQRPRGHGPEEPARPFRRYLVDGKWEVWVGRSNTENDELTHRAAHSRDIWLHAQGVAGSHVILRTGGHPERVPRPVLAKAAALAALNSKARHAGLVPVIHTERRYVRKPRKAPAGTAVCLQDQSLFVAPGVMAGVEPA